MQFESVLLFIPTCLLENMDGQVKYVVFHICFVVEPGHMSEKIHQQ
jgi:hypothetical protein